MRPKKGTVTLVGAGCTGDLITVRGLRALKRANVILYDDLIDESLLSEARDTCELVYVGKRYGKYSLKQEEIEDLLIRYALEGKSVVRLKGGDSFVFGRGGEEIMALQKADIPYEVIPGITSSVAVPEILGIPVTHRQKARSFTVVTGHTADETEENYRALAQLNGTLVFLMGLHAAGRIAASLMKFGKDPKTPAAILSKGFTAEQKRWDCTLETLKETANLAETPAILVIGDTAAMHLEATVKKPLYNKKIAVTGTEHFINAMSQKLKDDGASVTICPCLAIHAKEKNIPENLKDFQWITFTSANGVHIFFEEMKHRGYDIRQFYRQKFAVIGKGTAAELAKYGIQADFVPSRYLSDTLGYELAARIREEEKQSGCKEKVLILRAANGSPRLTEELTKAGIAFDDIKIYETHTNAVEQSDIQKRLEKCDYITFSSGAGVRAYFAEYPLSEKAIPVCIGPNTAEIFRQYSAKPYLMPDEYTIDGMRKAMIDREKKNA